MQMTGNDDAIDVNDRASIMMTIRKSSGEQREGIYIREGKSTASIIEDKASDTSEFGRINS